MKQNLILSILFLLWGFQSANGQLSVMLTSDSLTPTQLIKHYFQGAGISISNVTYEGDAEAIGLLTDSNAITGFQKGILLSNGRADIFPGRNSRPNAGANFGRHFFSDPDFRTSTATCDGAVIEFDFVPAHDSITFRFLFGSEEYPEFVGKSFNDVFALLLKPNSAKGRYQNLGVLPNGESIMINNVNEKRNAEWYVSNAVFSDPLYDYIEYDGITVPIRTGARVIPGKSYHLKVLIADLEDCEYDSGVLLEAFSLQSIPSNKPVQHPVKRTYRFQFNVNSSSLKEQSIKQIKRLADSLHVFRFDSIYVIGHTDSSGSERNNLTLSKERAQTVASYLSMYGTQSRKWVIKGAGSSEPLVPNTNESHFALNRRVELYFYGSKRNK